MRRNAWWGLALGGAAAIAGLALQAAAQKPGDIGFAYGDLREVTLQGRLRSLPELLAAKYGARVAGAGAEAQWALVLPEGKIYTFLDNEGYRKLTAAGLGNRAVEVQARLFPRSMVLEVTGFRPIPPEAVARRFYCPVCDIHSDDFGPCPCCGKELELAQPGR